MPADHVLLPREEEDLGAECPSGAALAQRRKALRRKHQVPDMAMELLMLPLQSLLALRAAMLRQCNSDSAT